MRIVAGKYKGRKILSSGGGDFRPTLDRVKEALFSTLAKRVEDCFFGDIYAGSGSIGLEALSRGASRVVFVENSRKRRLLIEKNCSRILSEEDKRKVLFLDDVRHIIENRDYESYFDTLFYDPPYATFEALIERKIIRDFMENAFSLVKKKGIFVLEAPQFFLNQLKQLDILPDKEKKYGKIYLLYYCL
ncbi:MAG: 16S rRNA (guanine(966)-N(2))-methyltransferase RsmD [Candidatus Aureabacteria bacterium]|nr:16S rRNA (guanine(966)-N(2))-methyltransferase RsmD [Candidatus Auribacterota bacterium]